MTLHNLEGRFPDGDDAARASMDAALTSIPDGERVIIDGLAMSGLPESVRPHAARLKLLGLVHHPLADETGLSAAEQEHFETSERAALGSCIGVLVTSGYTARRLADFGVSDARVRAIPPGTESAVPASGPPAGAPPALLSVATVTPRKGHDVMVEALGLVRDLDWTCVCAGSLDRDDVWVARVRARVSELGLDDRIDFVGEHDASALEGWYRAASVFVLASHYEGYGMALAEALARGLPVVSTTGGAIPFTVPAETGLLVEPGHPEAFAEALRRMLDPEERDRFAAAALAHGRALPDWDASIDDFGRAITELT